MTIDAALARLDEAVRLRRGPFRLAALATIAKDRPQVRHVIIRSFSPAERKLVFFCRADDAKYGEIQQNPFVELAIYGRDPDCQIRLSGRAEIITDPALLDGHWAAVSLATRRDYVAEGVTPSAERAVLFAAIAVEIERIKVLTYEDGQWQLRESAT